MAKRVIIIGVIVLIIAAIGFKLAANKQSIEEKKVVANTSDVVIPVKAVNLALQNVDDQLVKTGNLIPFREADITALTSGKLISVNFSLGSMVGQGGVVAQVDSRALQLNLEAANLQRNKADKDFKRYKALLEGEATTEATVQDVQLSYDNAANQIELLNKQIADNRIKAPISGQVVSKLKEPGEFVAPGAVLGHIVDVSRLKVNVMVGEKDAYSLKMGQTVKVTTDIYSGVVFEGKISFISAQGDATHNYQVEVMLSNRGDYPLKAGTFVYADFSKQSAQQLLLIPRTALVESLKNPYVYIIEDGKAKVKKISVGREMGDLIEVTEGLNVGEQVIIAGQVNIKEGTKVKGVM